MLGYIVDAIGYLSLGIIFLLLYMVIFELILKRKERKISWLQRTCIVILGIYLIIIFSVTVSPTYGFVAKIELGAINFIPGQCIRDGRVNPLNLFGNILMFIPIGFLIPLLSKKFRSFFRCILMGFSISLFIEFIQIFLSRGTDIDDLILNTLGTILGYLASTIILKAFPSIRTKLGIHLKQSGKLIKNDKLPLIVLIFTMLMAVMITGFYERYGLTKENTQELAENKEGFKNLKLEKDEKDKSKESNTEAEKFNNKTFQGSNMEVINLTDNKTLYSLNDNDKIAPASTTKMLTALTVLEYCNIDEKVKVGQALDYVASDASVAGLLKGQVLTVKQLLEAMLLPSGNDAAYVLAEYTGKSIKGDNTSTKNAIRTFIEKMNKKAKDIGADNSCFKSPDGYDVQGQYTTSKDMTCIAKTFINEKTEDYLLKKIAGSDHIYEKFPDGSEVTWKNSNQLLGQDSCYYYKNAIGLKTGSSDAAGCCLASAAQINGKTYICVVMGDSDAGRYEDTLEVFRTIEEN